MWNMKITFKPVQSVWIYQLLCCSVFTIIWLKSQIHSIFCQQGVKQSTAAEGNTLKLPHPPPSQPPTPYSPASSIRSSPPPSLTAPPISRSVSCRRWWIEGVCSRGCHQAQMDDSGPLKCFLLHSGQHSQGEQRRTMFLCFASIFNDVGHWVQLAGTETHSEYLEH